ncbi:MAG: hypothetical protein Q9221_005341 [Calogaya cf. arnoldii]
MYFHRSISPLFSLSFLFPPSFSSPALPPIPPLPLNIDEPILVSMTNTTPPFRYFKSLSPDALEDFSLIDPYGDPSEPPSYLRPIRRSAGVQILSWLMRESVANLPPEDPVGKEYLTWGPEYRSNLNYLDMRAVVRQFWEGDWKGVDVPAGDLTNAEVAAAAGIGGNAFGRGQLTYEYALWMCYLTEEWKLEKCVGIVMVQLDVWLRK